MAGYIGTQAVSVNTTSATISDDLTVGDDATIAGTLGINTTSPSNDVEIITSADAKGLTIKNAGNVRPYLNFDSNRTGAGNTLSQLNFKWNGADVARINAVAGADTTNKDDGVLVFFTAAAGSPTEAMRIASTGLVTVADGLTLTDGNLTVASGHGIDFSVTGDGAGTDSSELLDDYEEGTWAPVLAGLNAGSSNGTYSVQVGTYTKVGRLINANFHIDIGSLNDGTGALTITGLPYASANIANNYGSMTVPHVSGWSGNYYNISGLVGANSSQMPIYYQAGNGNMVAATHAQLQEGNFLATIVYQTAS